jgi:phosphoribosyl-AMP cyclohydrolase
MTAGFPDRCFRQKEAYKRMQEDKTTMEDKKIGYKPLTAAIPFSEFKLNEAGLIPAIVQELNHINQQFTPYMYLDCDNDTILARVEQIGAACHTGSRSCFFKNMLKDD